MSDAPPAAAVRPALGPDAPDVPLTLERRPSRALVAAVAALVALTALAALGVRRAALEALLDVATAAQALAADQPFVPEPRLLGFAVLAAALLAPVAAWHGLARWARRAGRVEVGHDEVVVDRPLAPWLLDERRLVVPASAITAVEPTPHGLRLLTAPRRVPWPLVPTASPADQAAAVAALDAARDPAADAERAAAGPTRAPPGVLAVLVLATLAVLAGFGLEPVFGKAAAVALAALACAGLLRFAARVSEGHAQVVVGRRRLAVADGVAPWAAVGEAALAEAPAGGAWLAADLGPGPWGRDGRRLARLGADDAERLRPLLARRLGARLAATLPAWAAGRVGAGARLRPLGLTLAAGLAGGLAPALVHDEVVWTDHLGQELRVLVRRADGGVRRLALVPGDARGPRTTRRLAGPWSPLRGHAPGGLVVGPDRVAWPDGRAARLARPGAPWVEVRADGRVLEGGAPRGLDALRHAVEHGPPTVHTLAALLPGGLGLADCAWVADRAGQVLHWRQGPGGRVYGEVTRAVLRPAAREAPGAPGELACWCSLPEVHDGEVARVLPDGRVRLAPLPALGPADLELARARVAAGQLDLDEVVRGWAPALFP